MTVPGAETIWLDCTRGGSKQHQARVDQLINPMLT
jgi:hypothetical protein